jgi:hypothetical protein
MIKALQLLFSSLTILNSFEVLYTRAVPKINQLTVRFSLNDV